jgi:hypothetical protein
LMIPSLHPCAPSSSFFLLAPCALGYYFSYSELSSSKWRNRFLGNRSLPGQAVEGSMLNKCARTRRMKEKEENKSRGTNGTNTGQTRTREKEGEKNLEAFTRWQHPESNRGSRVVTVSKPLTRTITRCAPCALLPWFNLLGAETGERNSAVRKARGRGGWWKSCSN